MEQQPSMSAGCKWWVEQLDILGNHRLAQSGASNMRRIKIAHCLETVGSGGVEQRRLSLAARLDPERYEQIVVCTQAIGGLPPRFEAVGCAVHEIGQFRRITDVTPYRKALDILRAYQPDIVHGAVFEGVAVAAVAGRLAGTPVVLGEETSDPSNRSWRGHLLYRGLAALTDQMVAVSPAVERYLLHSIRLPRSKVTLIINGVAEQRPASPEKLAGLRQQLGLASNHPLIGTVGRLVDSHKRVSDLIHAIALLRRQVPEAKLLIVGDGPDRSALEDLAANKGLRDAVIFAGYQSETGPFFELFDVFALASATEAFGLVLVEAMYAGLPVVATRVGGVPHVVENGQTGILVEPLSPEGIAQALEAILSNRSRALAMGESGQTRARRLFGVDRYVSEIDTLYRNMISAVGRS